MHVLSNRSVGRRIKDDIEALVELLEQDFLLQLLAGWMVPELLERVVAVVGRNMVLNNQRVCMMEAVRIVPAAVSRRVEQVSYTSVLLLDDRDGQAN